MNALVGEDEAAEELLVNLFLVRDYLRVQTGSQREVDERMQEGFPHTYDLALKFEASLEASAGQISGWSKAWQSVLKLITS